MIARVTTFQAKPDRIPEVEAALDGIRAQLGSVPGLLTSYSVWDESGSGVTFTVYEDAAAAEAALPAIQSVWAGLADHMAAAPEARAFTTVEKLVG